METDVMPSRVQVDSSIWDKLIMEVKEVLATGARVQEKPRKNFGVANMYKIRRNSSSATSLIRRW